MLGSAVLDAPSLTLAPELTPISVVFVEIGTGIIGLGVLDSTVDSVSVDSVWLGFVALACVVSIAVCFVVPLVSTVVAFPVVNSGDSEILAKVACEDSTMGTKGSLLLEALAVVPGPETPSVLDWTGSIVVGLVVVLDWTGTGIIGFGVLDSTGSEAIGPEDVLDAVNDVDFCEIAGSGVSVESETTGLVEAKSVRLRLAVALAGELCFPSVDVRKEVVISESWESVTGETPNEFEAIEDDSSFDAGNGVVDIDGVTSELAEADALTVDEIGLAGVIEVFAEASVGLIEGVVEASGVDSVSTESGTLALDGTALEGMTSGVVGVDALSSVTEVGLTVGVLDTGVLVAGVVIAGMLKIGVDMMTGVETGSEIAAAEPEGVSSNDSARVLFAALVDSTTGSVVLLLSVDGVTELMCLCLTVCLVGPVDVVLDSLSVVDGVGIVVDMGGIERVVEVEDGVVGTTTVVGVVSDGTDVDMLLRSSLSGTGDGGVWNGVLVALCVPFVTIIRLMCFKRYLGLSAPPCPAGAAAAAGLRVASTARDAAKTIDDLRTMAVIWYFNIIYIIRYW